MMYIKKVIMLFFGIFLYQSLLAQRSIDAQDKVSLQNGAKLFMNYCSGCHSLKYLRYNHMAEGLGLISIDGQIDTALLKNNLIFTQAQINDPIRIAMPPEDARQWFGIVPPDLSLIARERGTKWVYIYLSSFYKDDSKPFGTNNHLVPDVAMPNILETLRLDESKANKPPSDQFDSNVQDLVAFLAYVGEPVQVIRVRLGIWVLGFLFVLFFIALGLKVIYWRKVDIK